MLVLHFIGSAFIIPAQAGAAPELPGPVEATASFAQAGRGRHSREKPSLVLPNVKRDAANAASLTTAFEHIEIHSLSFPPYLI